MTGVSFHWDPSSLRKVRISRAICSPRSSCRKCAAPAIVTWGRAPGIWSQNTCPDVGCGNTGSESENATRAGFSQRDVAHRAPIESGSGSRSFAWITASGTPSCAISFAAVVRASWMSGVRSSPAETSRCRCSRVGSTRSGSRCSGSRSSRTMAVRQLRRRSRRRWRVESGPASVCWAMGSAT